MALEIVKIANQLTSWKKYSVHSPQQIWLKPCSKFPWPVEAILNNLSLTGYMLITLTIGCKKEELKVRISDRLSRA